MVAEELEAADILTVLPTEETMLEEFQTRGFVNIRVSTQSYEAATQLRTIVECEHWEERAQQPLGIPMVLAAVGLGLTVCVGGILFLVVSHAYKTKGYRRKAKSFRRWFLVGFALSFGLVVAFSH